MKDLHVISVVSNPCRYKRRYELYRQFEKHMRDSGAVLWTTEQAFGDRPHEVTQAGNPHHIQLRSYWEMWHKENMINLTLQRLPADWEYVAWIDADVTFIRPDWVKETIHQLQHYMIVQMFSVCYDMGPGHEPFQRHRGFCWSYHHGCEPGKRYTHWHPGFCWAARRETLEDMGGLIDFAILGGADKHMALALIGQMETGLPAGLHPGYIDRLKMWEYDAERVIKKDIGFVPGTICHGWHGKKKDRRYIERWKILIDNKYDPNTDLRRDTQGLLQLVPQRTLLRDQLRLYFRARNEDSIDLHEKEVKLT